MSSNHLEENWINLMYIADFGTGQKKMVFAHLYNFPSLIMFQNVLAHCLNFTHNVVFPTYQIPVISIDLDIFGWL